MKPVLAFIALLLALPGMLAAKSEARQRRLEVCKDVLCGTGQLCVLDDNDEPYCRCRKKCHKRSRPVCGSDDVTYINRCELHRTACITDKTIHARHSGACEAVRNTDYALTHRKPLVCYQIERDLLRTLLIRWLDSKTRDNQWILQAISYDDVVAEFFKECDADEDGFVEADEFLKCTERNITQSHKPETLDDIHVLRGLCIDALVSLIDRNLDWKLTSEEFNVMLDPELMPSKKVCYLLEKTYDDGAETRVNCNLCVCACGNWVCTGSACDKHHPETHDDVIYVVTHGGLPSKAERRKLLEGFRAADDINIDAIDLDTAENGDTVDATGKLGADLVETDLKHKVSIAIQDTVKLVHDTL